VFSGTVNADWLYRGYRVKVMTELQQLTNGTVKSKYMSPQRQSLQLARVHLVVALQANCSAK